MYIRPANDKYIIVAKFRVYTLLNSIAVAIYSSYMCIITYKQTSQQKNYDEIKKR